MGQVVGCCASREKTYRMPGDDVTSRAPLEKPRYAGSPSGKDATIDGQVYSSTMKKHKDLSDSMVSSVQVQDKAHAEIMSQSLNSVETNDLMVQLHKARDSQDCLALVKLLPCDTEIQLNTVRMHPWAANPRTIGCLAMSQLAIFASSPEMSVRMKVVESGCVPMLLSYLKDPAATADRKEAAMLTLTFISDLRLGRDQILKDGGFEVIIPYLSSQKTGMQSAAVQLLQNLYSLAPERQWAFVQAGGVPRLVKLLESESKETVLDALYGIEQLAVELRRKDGSPAPEASEDMVEGSEKKDEDIVAHFQTRIGMELIQCKALDYLFKLTESKNEDVAQIASALFQCLQMLQQSEGEGDEEMPATMPAPVLSSAAPAAVPASTQASL